MFMVLKTNSSDHRRSKLSRISCFTGKGKMRPIKSIAKGILKSYHWLGLWQGFSVYTNPITDMSAYIFGLKRKGDQINLKCNGGFSVFLNQQEDLITVHEIFARNDYPVVGNEKIILDIGGNIGVSAKFFIYAARLKKSLVLNTTPETFTVGKKIIQPATVILW